MCDTMTQESMSHLRAKDLEILIEQDVEILILHDNAKPNITEDASILQELHRSEFCV